MTLGGTAEVANELGCRKTQLHALRQRGDFPEPIVVLSATPVWDLDDVRAFRQTWKRRKIVLDSVSLCD